MRLQKTFLSGEKNNLFLIVGLGNPGEEYANTRHNVGFLALDFLASEWGLNKFKSQKKFKALTTEGWLENKKIILAKPETFMNNSGGTVGALKNFYKTGSEKIIAVYDELDLPFGKIRVRADGSSAGHNGIKSIITKLGTDKFKRVRIGTRNEQAEKMEASDFVLAKFSKREELILKKEILPAAMEEIEKIIG